MYAVVFALLRRDLHRRLADHPEHMARFARLAARLMAPGCQLDPNGGSPFYPMRASADAPNSAHEPLYATDKAIPQPSAAVTSIAPAATVAGPARGSGARVEAEAEAAWERLIMRAEKSHVAELAEADELERQLGAVQRQVALQQEQVAKIHVGIEQLKSQRHQL